MIPYCLPTETGYLAALIIGLVVCPQVGDYVLQSHRMALGKTSSWAWAGLHASAYTLPFLMVTWEPWALLIIGGTHAVIDRLRLGARWCAWYGVGQAEGWAPARALPPVQPAPEWLQIWLSIRADNAMHRAIEAGVLLVPLLAYSEAL